jgi:hypothetical protein
MVYLWEVVILRGSEQAKTSSRVFGIYAIFIHLSAYFGVRLLPTVISLQLFFSSSFKYCLS